MKHTLIVVMLWKSMLHAQAQTERTYNNNAPEAVVAFYKPPQNLRWLQNTETNPTGAVQNFTATDTQLILKRNSENQISAYLLGTVNEEELIAEVKEKISLAENMLPFTASLKKAYQRQYDELVMLKKYHEQAARKLQQHLAW